MRLLADENFPGRAVTALRGLGHDVSWAVDLHASTNDEHILEVAGREKRVIITLDKDFGELAFRRGLPATCGIVLFRFPADPELITAQAIRVLPIDSDFTGRFVVVEVDRLRERPLSASG
jgi:hypothetical protein